MGEQHDHVIDTGKGTFDLSALGPLLPGVADLMNQVGDRMWKCFYAGKAKNKALARFQLKEAVNLLEKAAFLEGRYAPTIENFIGEEADWLREIIEGEEWGRFEEIFGNVVSRANIYHHLFDRPFIKWQIPATPPPDLDVTPTG